MLALFGVVGVLRVVGFGGFVAAVWLCWLVVVVCDFSLVGLIVYVCLLLPGILVVDCLCCFTGYCVAGGFSFAWVWIWLLWLLVGGCITWLLGLVCVFV